MLSDQTAFFEGAFRILNDVYFKGMLPSVILTIQSTPHVYGHITIDKVWTQSMEKRQLREINIGADYLDRPIENVLSTLLHEMVHLYCSVKRIHETSNAGRYHNKLFKAECEKRDLSISKANYIGWSLTAPTDRFVEVLKANGLYVDLQLYRDRGIPTAVGGAGGSSGIALPTQKKKSSTRKYFCPACGISVRATKDVNIACLDCSNVMIKVDN